MIDRPKDRIDHLVAQLEKAGERIIVPTPVLSEVLVRVKPAEAQQLYDRLGEYKVFRVEPFDAKAAIELAGAMRESG